MKNLSLACALLAPAALADEIAKGSTVTAEFIGSSGGLKIYPASDSNKFLMVQQLKLEEIDSAGRKVKEMQMSGSNEAWTPMTVDDSRDATGAGTEIFTTQFSKTDAGRKFTLMAHLSRQTTNVIDPVACTACAADGSGATSGECKSTTDSTCSAATGTNSDQCAAGSELCTVTNQIIADTIKFSVRVSGWAFASATNKLVYGLELKTPNTNNGSKQGSLDATSLFSFMDSNSGKEKSAATAEGYVVTPTAASIHGGGGIRNVQVKVDMLSNGGKDMIHMEFPSFSSTEELFYDPDLHVNGGSFAVPSFLVGAALFLANALA